MNIKARDFRFALLAWVALFCSFAASVKAAKIEVSFLSGEKVEPASGVLRAAPVHGSENEVVVEARVPGTVGLDLPEGTVWRLALEAPGFWAAPSVVTVEPAGAAVSIPLWRTGTVGGTLALPRGERAPEVLRARFRPALVAAGASGAPTTDFTEATVECPVDDGEWLCRLPAARLDLRLRAQGFISHYRWGVEIRPRYLRDLGELDLRRGSSLVGVLEVAQGRLVPEKAKVWISPYMAASASPLDLLRQKGLTQYATVGRGGFFHFEDIRPGSYIVEAEQEGGGSTTFYPVAVMENAETELRQPLVLEPPLELAVSVDPPVDPLGRTWNWKLYELSDVLKRMELRDEGTVSEGGTWAQGDLESGEYLVAILDREGSRFAFEEVRLEGASGELYLELPLVFVEGTVRLGEEPLVADVVFGGLGGTQKIELKSDDEGRFAGMLPREGEWKVLVWSEHPQIRRTLPAVEVAVARGAGVARVDLELPDTELRGEVVDESGHPVFAASVDLIELDHLQPTKLKTGEDGRFRFLGLGEGTVSVSAKDGDRSSEQVTTRIAEGIPSPELRLVVRRSRQLTGRVVSASGGVPGARVMAGAFQANGSVMLFGHQTGTDVEGTFHLEMPAAASHLQLAVFAPGYSLALTRVPGETTEPVVVQVQPDGGELNLELGGGGEPLPSHLQPVLFADGMVLDRFLLESWARFNHQANPDPGRLIVPSLPPGPYTACLLPGGAALATSAIVPQPGRCAEGFLTPGGVLSLEVPGGEATGEELSR